MDAPAVPAARAWDKQLPTSDNFRAAFHGIPADLLRRDGLSHETQIDRESSENTKPGSDAGKSIEWHSFTDLHQSVLTDVKKIKNHPLVPSHIQVRGFIFDVKTGKINPVND